MPDVTMPPAADPQRILVVSLKRLGDVLLTTPVVKEIRGRFPRARIDFLVYPEFAEILTGNPSNTPE